MFGRILLPVMLGGLLMPMSTQASQCYGTTAAGSLEGGVELPAEGPNFENYSGIARTLGRNYVHSEVAKIIAEAYGSLEKTRPQTRYKYGETGFEDGGRFKPHKTHQNGLSVDFFVPVVNVEGESVLFSTGTLNRFGYDVEFDEQGRLDELQIDFEAMADHLVALHKATIANGRKLWRVIFDPQLQPMLMATAQGDYLRQHLTFSTRPSWVRHDEHYHVDFDIPCLPLPE